MVLFIDNYDSFTYNLVQLAGLYHSEMRVVRNDAVTVREIRGMRPSHIILSPGPGHPRDAGICETLIREMHREVPILGVCLGHQAICESFGGSVTHARRLMHGKKSTVTVDRGHPIFRGLPERIDAARYHSLIALRESVPEELRIIAEDSEGEVMALAHRDAPLVGLQFHPESVLTPEGARIMKNFFDTEAAQ